MLIDGLLTSQISRLSRPNMATYQDQFSKFLMKMRKCCQRLYDGYKSNMHRQIIRSKITELYQRQKVKTIFICFIDLIFYMRWHGGISIELLGMYIAINNIYGSPYNLKMSHVKGVVKVFEKRLNVAADIATTIVSSQNSPILSNWY